MQSASCVYNILQNQHIIKTKTVMLEKPQRRKLSVCPMLDPPFSCTYSVFQKHSLRKVSLFICVFVCKSSWTYANAFTRRFAYLCMHTGARRSVVFLCRSLPLPWRHGQPGTWIFWARMEAITPQQSCLWLSQNKGKKRQAFKGMPDVFLMWVRGSELWSPWLCNKPP